MASVRSGVILEMGLVGCRVDVQGAIESDNDTTFNNVCTGVGEAHAPSGVGQKLACKVCGNDDEETFLKGKVRKDSVTLVDVKEIEAAMGVTPDVTERICLTIHPTEQVEAAGLMPSDKPYWLVPSSAAEGRVYGAMVKALTDHPEYTAISEWAPRTKRSMVTLRVVDGALAMQRMAWPGAIKAAPAVEFDPTDRIADQMATLMEMAASDFDAETYQDTRTQRLRELLATGDTVAVLPTTTTATTAMGSLEDQLAAAIEAASKAKPIKGAESKAKATTTEGKVAKKAAPKKKAVAKAS